MVGVSTRLYRLSPKHSCSSGAAPGGFYRSSEVISAANRSGIRPSLSGGVPRGRPCHAGKTCRFTLPPHQCDLALEQQSTNRAGNRPGTSADLALMSMHTRSSGEEDTRSLTVPRSPANPDGCRQAGTHTLRCQVVQFMTPSSNEPMPLAVSIRCGAADRCIAP